MPVRRWGDNGGFSYPVSQEGADDSESSETAQNLHAATVNQRWKSSSVDMTAAYAKEPAQAGRVLPGDIDVHAPETGHQVHLAEPYKGHQHYRCVGFIPKSRDDVPE